MDKITNRRPLLRWAALTAAAATLTACHVSWHIPPGQIRRQQTPAATGTEPGQKKKKN